ncbi:MAG: hypothetical protein H6Q00_2518, partial [Holophagaceae bacterium]|nr:hypothetical protein [Holophagaceae bacterium]
PHLPKMEDSKPLEVEELSGGEMLEEIEELPSDGKAGTRTTALHLSGHTSVVEVPVVLDRSLFNGEGPVEIKLKLYLK